MTCSANKILDTTEEKFRVIEWTCEWINESNLSQVKSWINWKQAAKWTKKCLENGKIHWEKINDPDNSWKWLEELQRAWNKSHVESQSMENENGNKVGAHVQYWRIDSGVEEEDGVDPVDITQFWLKNSLISPWMSTKLWKRSTDWWQIAPSMINEPTFSESLTSSPINKCFNSSNDLLLPWWRIYKESVVID